MEKLSVTVSTIGRFHAFNLVQQLQQQDCLHSFISAYPKFAVTRYGDYGIDGRKYYSISWLNIIQRIWRKLPIFIKSDINPQLWFHERFDLGARRYISDESNVFVGWSSLCLESMRRAKDLGAITIV
ncbi:MAG: glycosyltransferase family 1 protein, partial [Leptolyngbya sp. SIO3F4]|nr:glycosyltransferase family 1 protein [Leptolyngbya sp. SIO3F4]